MNMNQISNNAIRQILILLTILLLGIVLFRELSGFIPAFLGAYTLYVLLRKWMFMLQGKYKWNKSLAAAVLMLLSFLIILLPCFLVVNMLASKIAFAVQHSSEVLASIEKFVHKYEQQYKIGILTEENIGKVSNWGQETLPKILGATFDTLSSIVIMYFILFTFNTHSVP